MISDKINAANLLRLYTWEVLDQMNVLEKVRVSREGDPFDVLPIVPVEDEPLLRDSGKPYIIYGWSENEESAGGPVERGNLALRIIANDTNQLNYITNVVSRIFKDEDEVVPSVNYWTSTNPLLVGIRFTWLKTILVESADPATSEGGQNEGSVMVGYRYVTDHRVKSFHSDNIDGSQGYWQ